MRSSSRFSLAACSAAAALVLAACSGGNTANPPSAGEESSQAEGGETLVIDTAFSLETGDPGRTYVPTGNMVLHAVYDTLLTFEGSDEELPVPSLATMEQNEEATEFTFTLTGERTFSDGTPVTADDVVYSLERVQGITESKANFLMDGITVEKIDEQTVKLSTEEPYLQLPAIVTNPALGIVNSELAQENGATTDNDDDAEEFFNSTSAGSGPYMIDSLDITSQVVLVPNPEYDGEYTPEFERIVVRNVSESSTQLINLQGGDSNLAVDLNGDQVESLGEGLKVTSQPSAQAMFLLINQSEEVGGDTANPDFAEAVRYALDYGSLVELAGVGAEPATGVIPPLFLGALEEGVTQDLDRAKAALDASGYDGETITLEFPNDNPIGGVEFTPVAERVQSQLQEIGLEVNLAPAPFATQIDPYVDGKEAFSLWYWGPDFADSSSFLPFGPGEKVGLRANWTEEDSPEIADLVKAAQNATSVDEREEIMTDFATAMQESGPFVPIIVVGANLASDESIDNVQYNSNWTLDIPLITPAG